MGRSSKVLALLFIAAGLGGCAELVFTMADRGREREVDTGSVFTVSLPDSGKWRRPRIAGTAVTFLSERREGVDNQALFEFRAERSGFAEISIPFDAGPKVGEDFILRVHVSAPMHPVASP